MKFVLHRSPIGIPAGGHEVSLSKLNSPEFNLKDHFWPDTVCKVDNYLIVNKTKSWSNLDLMILFADEKPKQSFSQLSEKDIRQLFEICAVIAECLKPKCKRIFIGSNINHGDSKQIFSRLHLHVVGYSKEQCEKMEEIDSEKLSNPKKRFLFDPQIPSFQKDLDLNDFKPYELGLEKTLSSGFEIIKNKKFISEIKNIDRKISDVFPSLPYSFCLELDQNRWTMYLVPRSVFGKGVLEAAGIILERSAELNFSTSQIEAKKDFFECSLLGLKNHFKNTTKGPYLDYLNTQIKENYYDR